MRALSALTLALLFTPVTLTSPPALAQETPLVIALPEGQSVLNISATEQQEVKQDLLIASLRIEFENESPATVQDKINEIMAGALKEAEKYSDVKTATQSYNIYSYDQNRNNKNLPPKTIWKGSQSLQIKSTNADDVLKLAGKLQDMGLVTNGLSYTLSPALAARVQDEMMEDALAKLQTRADRAAKALGKTKATLREVHVQGQSHFGGGAPIMRSMAMDESAMMAKSAPVASAGETMLTLDVSATVLLSQ